MYTQQCAWRVRFRTAVLPCTTQRPLHLLRATATTLFTLHGSEVVKGGGVAINAPYRNTIVRSAVHNKHQGECSHRCTWERSPPPPPPQRLPPPPPCPPPCPCPCPCPGGGGPPPPGPSSPAPQRDRLPLMGCRSAAAAQICVYSIIGRL